MWQIVNDQNIFVIIHDNVNIIHVSRMFRSEKTATANSSALPMINKIYLRKNWAYYPCSHKPDYKNNQNWYTNVNSFPEKSQNGTNNTSHNSMQYLNGLPTKTFGGIN